MSNPINNINNLFMPKTSLLLSIDYALMPSHTYITSTNTPTGGIYGNIFNY